MPLITADEILAQITDAAEGAFKEGWAVVKNYAPAEFKKMAVQLEDIATNVALFEIDDSQGYSAATGQVLFRMQRLSCEAVLVAVTQLTLITVQKALDAILKVLKSAFQGALAAIL